MRLLPAARERLRGSWDRGPITLHGMKIAEIFYSIQGEGMLTGVPSVFVRTSGCNLRCVWCDTPYTSWTPEGDDMTVAAILETVKQHPAKHAVITGGEPMIAPQIVELSQGLKS